jgi:hypothetical protein
MKVETLGIWHGVGALEREPPRSATSPVRTRKQRAHTWNMRTQSSMLTVMTENRYTVLRESPRGAQQSSQSLSSHCHSWQRRQSTRSSSKIQSSKSSRQALHSHHTARGGCGGACWCWVGSDATGVAFASSREATGFSRGMDGGSEGGGDEEGRGRGRGDVEGDGGEGGLEGSGSPGGSACVRDLEGVRSGGEPPLAGEGGARLGSRSSSMRCVLCCSIAVGGAGVCCGGDGCGGACSGRVGGSGFSFCEARLRSVPSMSICLAQSGDAPVSSPVP